MRKVTSLYSTRASRDREIAIFKGQGGACRALPVVIRLVNGKPTKFYGIEYQFSK